MAEILELEISIAGRHISSVCEQAAKMAEAEQRPVHFVFNDTHITAQIGESAKVLEERWTTEFEANAKAYRESPEYKKLQADRAENERRERLAVMVENAKTEKEMRDAKVPWPKTRKHLDEYVDSLIDRQHDYGTCVYAMSMAAVAAFNYVAGTVGSTGFQASCADMDIIRRTRSIKGPFMIIKGEDALYPQYDLPERLAEAMEGWKPWLKEEAKKKLAENPDHVHPDVKAHWEKLATD